MKYYDEYDYMFDFTYNDYVFRNEKYKMLEILEDTIMFCLILYLLSIL